MEKLGTFTLTSSWLYVMDRLDRSSIWFILVLLTAASFPWHERINTVGVILLVLHWLWDRNLVFKIKNLKLTPSIGVYWLFLLYHLVGLSFSSYMPEGMHSIEVKLSFFILPLLFSTENYFTSKRRKVFEWVFILSCVAALLYCVAHTLIFYFHSPLEVMISRMTFSEGIMHPGYLSNFMAFALVLLLNGLFNRKDQKSIGVGIHVMLVLFLLFGLIVLASKTALLFIGFVAIYSIWHLSSSLKNIVLRISAFILILCAFLGSMYNLPNLKERILETINHTHALPPEELYFFNSTGSRLAAWQLSWEIVKQKPIVGYGTGAANPLLLNEFKTKGYVDLVKYNMHTHNQVLHTWMDLGLIGLSLLLLWWGWVCFEFAFRSKEVNGVFLMLLILVNLATDDMLEIQAGAVFFVFFSTLYLFKNAGYKRPLTYSY